MKKVNSIVSNAIIVRGFTESMDALRNYGILQPKGRLDAIVQDNDGSMQNHSQLKVYIYNIIIHTSKSSLGKMRGRILTPFKITQNIAVKLQSGRNRSRRQHDIVS